MATSESVSPVPALQELRAAKETALQAYERARATVDLLYIAHSAEMGRATAASDAAYLAWTDARAAVIKAERSDLPARPADDRDEVTR